MGQGGSFVIQRHYRYCCDIIVFLIQSFILPGSVNGMVFEIFLVVTRNSKFLIKRGRDFIIQSFIIISNSPVTWNYFCVSAGVDIF